MNERHTRYTYGKVLLRKNAWIGMNVTICPGVMFFILDYLAIMFMLVGFLVCHLLNERKTS